ncbi:hypothetical protein [Clostridium sp. JN-9]|uniref:hypothetical protein n=1 Tax=Clostridium sp. JN-9 TaxID=2507159 RepID=UPI000FFDF7F9|nr:hypothetical protein [Clostridium sp. JN-9]QAT41002.1 hypothetical protein EQM05_12410 [Clostridium sp. JN-9]
MNKIIFNKNIRIGKVLFVVEGTRDEMYILHKIFTKVFDYQYETRNRLDEYRPYNKKENPLSSIFVINTKESNIKDIKDADGYLDDLFTVLINEYEFPVNKAAIFYIFDRDNKSNTDSKIFRELINNLKNSREPNNVTYTQGLLLLGYPSIESFTASNYIDDTFNIKMDTGRNLKSYLNSISNCTNQRINKSTIEKAVKEMLEAITNISTEDYNLDDFSQTNMKIYEYQEEHYLINKNYKLLSLLCISLIDLRLIEIEDENED